MKKLLYLASVLCCNACITPGTTTVTEHPHHPHHEDKIIQRIAFGSCSNQNKAQPILYKVIEKKPDLFIYTGDNIYGDTWSMQELREKYQVLGAKEEFQKLQATCPILATWDDHDFGTNDVGKFHCCKEASKDIFLEFWKEPEDSERRTHKGIYHTVFFGKGDKTVQVILLDTRTFRDNLLKNDKKNGHKNDYRPHTNDDSTMLGEEQWAWLETQLKEPATLRVIASSNQFAHEYNGWESWTNFPAEQERMFDLIKKTRANGVVFISGDVHWGELSKREKTEKGKSLPYPIYDITSSGLTQSWGTTEPNKYRMGDIIRENNFGLIEIDWEKATPEVTFSIWDVNGTERVKQTVKIEEISNKP